MPGPLPHEDGETSTGEPAAPLVRVRIFTGTTALMEADMARNLLQTEGIPCVLPGHVMGNILPGIEPIQMFVREEDAGRASDILTAYLGYPLEEEVD